MDCGGFVGGGDYHSEFDSDAESLSGKAKRQRREGDYSKNADVPHLKSSQTSATHRPYKAHHSRALQEYDAHERQKQRSQFLSLSAFDRHKKLVNDYLLYYGGSKKDLTRDSRFDKTDLDVVREKMQFIYEEEQDNKGDAAVTEPSDWGERVAKRYWDKLFKEYAIADLTHFQTGQIGLRWRTHNEVVNGKGQFQCANKYCQEKDNLQSWEVNFAYRENETKKNALVKLRLCPECSVKLNYKKQHRASKPLKTLKDAKMKKSSKDHKKHSSKKKKNKKKKSRKRSRSSSSGSEDSKSDMEGSSKDEPANSDVTGTSQKSGSSVWKEPVQVQNNDDDKAIEFEIDDYFADMLA